MHYFESRKTMNNPKVAIIILNWNGKEDTIECLESLKHITYPDYEILLVDNGSTDGSVESFREQYMGMEIIENGMNLGFAEGNNVGIRRAMDEGADYVLLLNNDTVVDPGFLGEMVKVAKGDERIGFSGPLIYYYNYNNRKDVVNFAGGKLDMSKGNSYHIGMYKIDEGQFNKLIEVDYLDGSCLLIKKDLINRVGLLDPVYFTYWEETDWCIRGYKAGFKSVFVPNAKIWHKIGSSDKKGIKEFYIVRNRIWFMKKYATKLQYLSFAVYFLTFRFWFTSGILLVHDKDIKGFTSFLKGIVAGLFT